VVRDTKTLDKRIESTCDISMSPEEQRVRRRSFAYGNTTIENPDVTRDIVARADADFERIFGSE
jgi:hypothetical protein